MDETRQFETIVSEHYASLFKFAMSLTRVESDAQDLTQQTFYVWATKGHQLRDISKVKTWLFTTLHRAFLESRRRSGRFEHHSLEDVSDELPLLEPGFSARVDSAQALSALAELDPIYRAAVALFYLEDYSYNEIGEILGIPVGTVKSRIARGILRLRKTLEQAAREPGPVAATGEAKSNLGPGDGCREAFGWQHAWRQTVGQPRLAGL